MTSQQALNKIQAVVAQLRATQKDEDEEEGKQTRHKRGKRSVQDDSDDERDCDCPEGEDCICPEEENEEEESGGRASRQLHALAMNRSRRTGESYAVAMANVLRANPKLYTKYLRENSSQL